LGRYPVRADGGARDQLDVQLRADHAVDAARRDAELAVLSVDAAVHLGVAAVRATTTAAEGDLPTGADHVVDHVARLQVAGAGRPTGGDAAGAGRRVRQDLAGRELRARFGLVLPTAVYREITLHDEHEAASGISGQHDQVLVTHVDVGDTDGPRVLVVR